jgi:hypothetical protein
MTDYMFVVLSNPMPGKEDDYNRWYTETHLQDMLAVPGFTAAQRFALAETSDGAPASFKYCALYEATTDDPRGMLDEVLRRAGGLTMPIDPGMDSAYFAVLYRPITPRVTKAE